MKVLDMHCDTISRLREEGGTATLRVNDIHVSLEKMRQGDYLLQNFAVFVDQHGGPDPLEAALTMVADFHREMAANEDLIRPVVCYQDIMDNQQNGRMSAMLTLEEGGILKGKIEFLRIFYQLGVRMIGLTWNYPNQIGTPNLIMQEELPLFDRRSDQGLTQFGIELVQEMERLGMIIDVSHLSDGGFRDVLQYTAKPFVASHSNAAAVCNVSRNLTDEMIRALAERGGVMGLNFAGSFLTPQMNSEPYGEYTGTIADMVRHLQHIKNVGGIDVCALGSDFDGIPGAPEIRDAASMQLLAHALEKSGFRQDEIEKVFYRNALRVYREILN